MLTGGSDARYRASLNAGGAQFITRVEVWQKLSGTWTRIDPFGDDGLPITSGNMSATLQNRITRTLSLTVPISAAEYRNGAPMIPFGSGDLLDPLASELRVWAGWKAGALTLGWWPVFTGSIIDVTAGSEDATLTVSASDRAEAVIANRFITPRSAPVGALVSKTIIDLIDDVWSYEPFSSYDETYAVVPTMTWDNDRAGALDALTDACSSFWYANADGSFTFRVVPWSKLAYGAPVATFAAGSGLLEAQVKLSRSDVYNVVIIPSSTTDGSASVTGVSQDTAASSRTWIKGPMGVRVLKTTGDNVTTLGQANMLANQKRLRSLTTLEEWTATVLNDPSLELGDVCMIDTMGVQRTMALSRFRLSLTGKPEMETSWRRAGGEVAS